VRNILDAVAYLVRTRLSLQKSMPANWFVDNVAFIVWCSMLPTSLIVISKYVFLPCCCCCCCCWRRDSHSMADRSLVAFSLA